MIPTNLVQFYFLEFSLIWSQFYNSFQVNAYRVPISEILSTFPDQLIVKESAFDQWEQLSTVSDDNHYIL